MATIDLSASNACGAATLPAGGLRVKVDSQCATPAITSYSPASRSATINPSQSMALSITATGGQGPSTLTYQWYSNTVNSNSGGTLITGATSTSYVVSSVPVGLHYYYCVVGANCSPSSTPTTSDVFTVRVNDNPSIVNPGTGSFIGRTAFDVAMINEGKDCGGLTERKNAANIYANFAETSTNTQVYTFKPSGAVHNVRFMYAESQPGDIIVSMTSSADYSVKDITYACNVTVVYNSNLNALAANRTSSNPLTVDLYAIYNDGQGDRRVQLTVRIQDCAFCGAYVNRDHTSWLTFMCYNLGASSHYSTVESQVNYEATANTDPTVYGDLYQWGRRADGHQSRTSEFTKAPAFTDQPTHSKFIITNEDWCWVSGAASERWNDTIKQPNDPCPSGYRVPTQAQWGSLFRGGTLSGTPDTAVNNSWAWRSNASTPGFQVGSFLFLPAAGYRNYQSEGMGINEAGAIGSYWSSSSFAKQSAFLGFKSGEVSPSYFNTFRATGMSVRCVTEH
jgi:uncharacterized protein (TIGR02145 family)